MWSGGQKQPGIPDRSGSSYLDGRGARRQAVISHEKSRRRARVATGGMGGGPERILHLAKIMVQRGVT